MTEVVDFVELSTAEFGRWCKLQHVHAPAPLSTASFARVSLAAHEWSQAINVPDVTVTNVRRQRDVSGFSPRVAEVLLRLGHVFDQPDYSVYLVRLDERRRQLVSAAVSRGDEAVIVADLGDRTRIAEVPAGNMVVPLVNLQPRLTPARIPTVDVPERVRTDAVRAGRRESDESVLRRRGFNDQDLVELSRIGEETTAGGVVGAFFLRDGAPRPSPVCADWVESPLGCTMRFVARNGSHVISGADRPSLGRAASAALMAAHI